MHGSETIQIQKLEAQCRELHLALEASIAAANGHLSLCQQRRRKDVDRKCSALYSYINLLRKRHEDHAHARKKAHAHGLSLSQSALGPRLHVAADRADIVGSVVRAYRAKPGAWRELFREWDVKFAGEQGLDRGGLAREMCTLFFREILKHPAGLFEPVPEGSSSVLPLRGNIGQDVQDTLVVVGKILAKAVLDMFPLPRLLAGLFPLLYGDEPQYQEDIDGVLSLFQLFDKEAATNLGRLRSQTLGGGSAMLTYGMLLAEGGPETDRVTKGSCRSDEFVTDANKDSVIRAVVQHNVVEVRRPALEALRKGFNTVPLHHHLSLFSPEELQELLCGKAWSADDLVGYLRFGPEWDKCSQVASFLSRFIKSLPDDACAELGTFLTAYPCCPPGGLKQNISVIFHKDCERLPKANTCAFQVVLPAYHSYEVLEAKFNRALEEFRANCGFTCT